jgi:UDP-N-acetylglucosamine transferase subunit ALG13
MSSSRPKRVLAAASGGGHWIQLSRVVPAFEGCDVAYLTTLASYRDQVGDARFYVVRDANLTTKFKLALMAIDVALVVLREWPDVIVSTGAAPGFVAVRIGKLIGARTAWLDSMANAEEMSVSGRRAQRHADLWLTQWPHLATPAGPHYEGSVFMRLFITVGTQFPFDRLVRTADEWVGRTAQLEAFAQIGPGGYRPRHMEWSEFIDSRACRRHVEAASAVIAHAGMGSIITALELGKPIVVMPRRASLGEHRNDHQLATARGLLRQGKVTVAMDEAHLLEKLEHLAQLSVQRHVPNCASPKLIATLRQFIRTGIYVSPALAADASEGNRVDELFGIGMAGEAMRSRDRATEVGALING